MKIQYKPASKAKAKENTNIQISCDNDFLKNVLDAIISGTDFFCCFVFCCFVFETRSHFLTLDCSGSSSVDQVGLELRDPLAFVSQGLGLKTFTITQGLGKQN